MGNRLCPHPDFMGDVGKTLFFCEAPEQMVDWKERNKKVREWKRAAGNVSRSSDV